MNKTQKEYDEALKLKEMGNAEFKKGNYQQALKHYSRVSCILLYLCSFNVYPGLSLHILCL